MIKNFLNFSKKNFQENFNLQITFFIFLSLLGSFIEVISIGSLIPLMHWLLNFENYSNYLEFFFLKDLDFKENEIFFYFSFFIIFIFFIKLAYFLLLELFKNKILLDINCSLSEKLFNNLINRPFLYYSNNSSSKATNIVRGVDDYCNSLVQQVLKIIIDSLTLIFFIILLLYISFKVTLFSFAVVFILGLIIYYFTRKKLNEFGKVRFGLSTDLYRFLSESFRGIRELKLFNLHHYYLSAFSLTNKKYYKNALTISYIGFIPKIIVEFIVVTLFLIIIYYFYKIGKTFDEITILISSFVIIFLKILPLCLSLLYSSQIIKSKIYSFNIIKDELDHEIENLTNKEQTNIKENILAKDLFFSYDKKKYIFKNLNFNFELGKIIGISGESGSGKSTFIDILSGLLKTSSGIIKVDNSEINNQDLYWGKNLAYVSQEIFLYEGTILENITFKNDLKEVDDEKFKQALEEAQLENFIRKSEKGIFSLIGESGSKISGGQRQRIGIARALYINPKILILDESTSGIDLETEKKIFEKLKKTRKNMLILVISHRNETLSYCHEIFKIIDKKFSTIKK